MNPHFCPSCIKLAGLRRPDNELEFRCENNDSVPKIKAALPKRNKYQITSDHGSFNVPESNPGTINILFLLRKQSVSYNAKNNKMVLKAISSNNTSDYIIVVPGFE